MKKKLAVLIIGYGIVFPFISFSQGYFQQDVKYNINVTLDDARHELRGFESIDYTNNSAEDLSYLYFHLWPNGYKDNSTAMAKQLLESGNTFFYNSDEADKGYIDSLNFIVNGKPIIWKTDSLNIDICKLILNEPLKPGQTITITTPFRVIIPDCRISRLGHEGQSYQVSQWYPKPAVYDKNGWNQIPYLNQGEFYSEFGSFDVFITLPDNYVVGATGDLLDGEKELAWLENKSRETSMIIAFDENDISFPVSSGQTKTLHFHQDKVHDFAWFADKRYNVLKGEVELPYSKRKVTTWVMFTNNEANLWKNSIRYVNDAVYYYSKWIGEYPYNHATAVEGALTAGGGMEYPNITVISSAGDSLALETVIMHEVGHNWFYGILGTNERNHPWMDEGINSFYEYRYLQTKYPGSTVYLHFAKKFIHIPAHPERVERSLIYDIAAHLNNNQAAGLSSEEYSEMNYGGIVYEKVSLDFAFLKDFLGEKNFDKAMQQYFSAWKFKHPQPSDLKSIMEASTGNNLDWFFRDVINTEKKIDYKICKAKEFKDPFGWGLKSAKVTVKNKGEINAPFEITAYCNDTISGSIWFDGFKGKKNLEFSFKKFDRLCINSENDCPEYNRKDNSTKTKGIFRKAKPIAIQLLPGIDDPMKAQLCITPTVGFNNYNGLMAGAAIYNNPIPQKKFSYFVMPLYGIKSNSLAGYSRAGFTLLPRWDKLQLIWIGSSASRYEYAESPLKLGFTRIVPELLIKFRNKNYRSKYFSELRFRNFNISKEYGLWEEDSKNYLKTTEFYYINQLCFNFADKSKINPNSFSVTVEQGDNFMKAFTEFSYKISYNKPKKGFDIRGFYGIFVYNYIPLSGEDFRFKLTGMQGSSDYTFDHYFIGRNAGSGLLSQQFSPTDGGFKTFTVIGQSWEWLAALNLKTSLPGKTPFKLFADVGIFPDKNVTNDSKFPVFYDAGIQVTIINDIFELFFPVLMSKEIKDNIKLNGIYRYFQTIRFTLNLEKADPFKLIRDIR